MALTSQANFPFDLEPLVTLRNAVDTPEVATAAELPVSLQASGAAWWQADAQSFRYSAVVFNVQAIAAATGTYAFAVEVSTDEAFTAPIVVGNVASVTETGYYTVTLSGDEVDKVAPGAKFMRVAATLGGATPSISYHAFLAPVVGS